MIACSPAALLATVLVAQLPTLPAPALIEDWEASSSGWSDPTGCALSAVEPGQAWNGQHALHARYTGTASCALVHAITLSSATPFIRMWLYVPRGTSAGIAGTPASVTLVEATSDRGRIGLGLGGTTLASGPIVYLQPVVDGAPLATAAPEKTEVTEGTWHLVELSSSAMGSLMIWIDDVRLPRATWPFTPYTSLAFSSIAVGTLNGVGTSPLDVYLDALAMNGSQNGTFWSVALHANEVDWGGLTGTPAPGVQPGKAGGTVYIGAGTLATSAADFKVGARGLVATDSDTMTAAQVNAEWGAFSATAPTVYRRFWWRPGSATASGTRTLAAILDSRFTAGPIASLGTPLAAVEASGTALTLWGYDSTGARFTSASQRQAIFGWNLVELLVNGVGGPGEGRLYLNGQPAGTVPGRDFTGRVADGYVEGQIATGANDYAGTDSFDEIRTSSQVQPSTLRVFAPATAAIGECTAFELRALTSDVALAPIPALASVALAGATFYSDSTCGTVAPKVDLAPGLTARRLFFIVGSDPGSGRATLYAASPDYFAVPASVDLSGTDLIAPAAPTNVGRQPAIVGASGQLRVTWDASTSQDVSDYSVEMLGTNAPPSYVVSAPATVAAFKPDRPGQWSLQVVASDVLGHRSAPSGTLPVLVDWGWPRVPTFTAEPAYGTGTVTLSWPGVDDPDSALEPASGIRDFVVEQLSPDGGSSITLAADAGSYDYAVDSSGPDGVYVFRLVASDNAGNQTAQVAPPVFVDRTAPAVASVAVTPTVTSADVVVSWTASDGTGSGVESVDVTAFQLDAGSQTSSRVFPPEVQATFALSEGRYTFGVAANDRAGNASLSAPSEQVIVDKTPPAPPRSSSAAPKLTGVDLTWSASSDLLSGVERYLVYASRDGTSWDPPLSATGTTYSYAAPPGAYWFKVTAVDRAANESRPSPVAMAIVPGVPATIVLEAVPPVWAGQLVDVIATVLDFAGNQLTTFTGTVHFSSAVDVEVPPDYAFTLADAGRHRFITAARFPDGARSLTATDPVSGATGSIYVTATAPGPPKFFSTPPPAAVEGQPYRYDAVAYGVEPISYMAGATPVGMPTLKVDRVTGAVLWIPPIGSASDVPYQFGIIASNSAGSTPQPVPVVVRAAANPLTATLQANPNPSLAPSTVTLAASASSTSSLLTYAWDFGDGSVAPAGPASFAIHRYAFPGTYLAQAVVRDEAGTEGNASTIVQVGDAAHDTPPRARISPHETKGDAPYQVLFSCECAPGSNPIASYAWDFGDGTTSTESAPSRTFGPGLYHVRLYVTDAAGLTARDEAIVTVTEAGALPPSCRASVEPPAGPVPTLVRFTATAAPGQSPISKIEWLDEAGNVTPGSSIVAAFDGVGWHHRRLRVLDEAGHACWDTAVFTGYSQEGAVPPAIVSSPPSTAECGIQLEYQPVAMGTPPLAWSAASAPEGLTLDASTGRIVWTPSPAQSGPNPIELRASGSGTATQRFAVAVSCKGKLDLTTGCTGCAAAGGGGPIAALLLLLLAARRRR